MAITVEDGTGLANADAFVSVAYADSYHSARGNAATWDAGTVTTAQKEEAIRRATDFLSRAYRWKGDPVRGRLQALAWPRADVVDNDGFTVASDAVPTEIEMATAEIALAELSTPGVMAPTYTPSERLKAAEVGPISVEYDLSRGDAEAVRPVLLRVDDLVGPLRRGQSRHVGGSSRG